MPNIVRSHPLPLVLTIAGTDPSGGAGIQADIKSISATGCYAASVITALVAQNTQGVQAIADIPASFIQQQLDCVFQDLTIHAVKIGMLHSLEVIEVVVNALSLYKPPYVVLDPVMIAKNGAPLLALETMSFIKEQLFPLATLITPNLFEAEQILNISIANKTDMVLAAQTMAHKYQTHVLLKGGHLNADNAPDVLCATDSLEPIWFQATRIATKHTHGTGCTLSSAIASFLAQGFPLDNAIMQAKTYLWNAIVAGSQQHIGQGCGPVDHFYFLPKNEGDFFSY